jgi:hypothetical protein
MAPLNLDAHFRMFKNIRKAGETKETTEHSLAPDIMKTQKYTSSLLILAGIPGCLA